MINTMTAQRRIYLATSNPGKVREFQEAAQALGLILGPLPGLDHLLRSGTASHENSGDQENNLALLHQLERLPGEKFAAKYVSVIALARDGETLATFNGEAHGEMLTAPRGTGGFGYDPFFYFSALGQTFAELSLEQKRRHSHRGQAFHSFLQWYKKKEGET
jgi:non-canonical purine NTP pyrophosphatase (RdgB/HAM1 family)